MWNLWTLGNNNQQHTNILTVRGHNEAYKQQCTCTYYVYDVMLKHGTHTCTCTCIIHYTTIHTTSINNVILNTNSWNILYIIIFTTLCLCHLYNYRKGSITITDYSSN